MKIFAGATVLTVCLASPILAHPGSGIVIDRQGQVYFVDTGLGVWKIDLQGRLVRHEGPSYHWMTIDYEERFTSQRMAKLAGGDVEVIGPSPTLILSSDFPLTVGSDGAIYYPQPESDGRVRIRRLTPSGADEVFAVLPSATEIGADGQRVQATWIHGLAAGPNRSLYYAERHAVRRIASDGTVSLIASDITIPDCVQGRLGPALRGLEVAPDGTIYVAASACNALLKITQEGAVSIVLRGSDAWSPMGVAVASNDVYVLEYRYVGTTRREDWLPRVRKVSADGTVTFIATVSRR